MKLLLGKRLLVFTAHPDDESYAAAGTILKNAKAGGETVLVCATYGERGTSHLKNPISRTQCKQLRKRELQKAARFLGIRMLVFLGLPDAGVTGQKKTLFKRACTIAKRIAPEFILSFGNDGISGHKDHIAVGTTAQRIAKLLRVPFVAFALPPRVTSEARAWLLARRRHGRYERSIRFEKPNVRIAINTRAKAEALRFHASQLDNEKIFGGFPAYAVKEMLRAEYFIVNPMLSRTSSKSSGVLFRKEVRASPPPSRRSRKKLSS